MQMLLLLIALMGARLCHAASSNSSTTKSDPFGPPLAKYNTTVIACPTSSPIVQIMIVPTPFIIGLGCFNDEQKYPWGKLRGVPTTLLKSKSCQHGFSGVSFPPSAYNDSSKYIEMEHVIWACHPGLVQESEPVPEPGAGAEPASVARREMQSNPGYSCPPSMRISSFHLYWTNNSEVNQIVIICYLILLPPVRPPPRPPLPPSAPPVKLPNFMSNRVIAVIAGGASIVVLSFLVCLLCFWRYYRRRVLGIQEPVPQHRVRWMQRRHRQARPARQGVDPTVIQTFPVMTYSKFGLKSVAMSHSADTINECSTIPGWQSENELERCNNQSHTVAKKVSSDALRAEEDRVPGRSLTPTEASKSSTNHVVMEAALHESHAACAADPAPAAASAAAAALALAPAGESELALIVVLPGSSASKGQAGDTQGETTMHSPSVTEVVDVFPRPSLKQEQELAIVASHRGEKEAEAAANRNLDGSKNEMQMAPSAALAAATPYNNTVNEDVDHKVCCAVCLEDYETGDEVRLLPCMHYFHTDCVDLWMTVNNTCPVCRLELDAGAGNELQANLLDGVHENAGNGNGAPSRQGFILQGANNV